MLLISEALLCCFEALCKVFPNVITSDSFAVKSFVILFDRPQSKEICTENRPELSSNVPSCPSLTWLTCRNIAAIYAS
jgi:hypothetical protein